MKKSLLFQALNIAKRELNTHPEYHNYCHWSFVVVKNQIIEWATNHKGIPPIYFGYNKRLSEGNFAKTHSELAAYKRAKGILGKNNFGIINIRLNRKGDIRNSSPCICCSSFLKEVGCSEIYYSNNNDFHKFIF